MIILRSPEDGPWERRPGGGEQAPVRAPVRRAPGARGGSVPLRSPGILGPRAGACPPAGATQAREFRIPNGVGRGAGGPSLGMQKLCAKCSPLGRGRTPECVRIACGARSERAHGARAHSGARTERARNVHGVRARAGVRAERVRTSRGSSSGVLRLTLGSCALVVGSCRRSSFIPWELPTGAPASRGSCPRELLHPVGAAHGSSCIPSELLTGAPASRRSCSFGG